MSGTSTSAGPVELNVLTRREMPVALVIFARDIGEAAHLIGRQSTVRNGNTKHVCVKLKIEPVHQSQGFELIFRQLTGKTACNLGREIARCALRPWPRRIHHIDTSGVRVRFYVEGFFNAADPGADGGISVQIKTALARDAGVSDERYVGEGQFVANEKRAFGQDTFHARQGGVAARQPFRIDFRFG